MERVYFLLFHIILYHYVRFRMKILRIYEWKKIACYSTFLYNDNEWKYNFMKVYNLIYMVDVKRRGLKV